VWGPWDTPWGGPSPDMVYRWPVLDGQRAYRITGQRGTSQVLDFQLFDGYMEKGMRNMRSLGAYDIDAMDIAADGSFEILASAGGEGRNHIRLDPAERNIVIQVREIFNDWAGERPARLEIEALDADPTTMAFDEADLNRRIARAGGMIEGILTGLLGMTDVIRERAGGLNRFMINHGADDADSGGNARADYMMMQYALEDGEALIIDMAVLPARHWSISLTDPFWLTLEFSYHQSSLNCAQASIDEDGRFRAVISRQDPGVANWIDASQSRHGICIVRSYDGRLADGARVEKVRLDEVAGRLPATTPRVTAAERAALLRRRGRDSVRRWGY